MIVIGLIGGLAVFTFVRAQFPDCPRAPKKVVARAELARVQAGIAAWRQRFGAYPPAHIERLPPVSRLPIAVGKVVPPNTCNAGIESLFQALTVSGFSMEGVDGVYLCNTDSDALDRPLSIAGHPDLMEIRDPWGNPLVYFEAADYVAAEKDPPCYLTIMDSVGPKPWRDGTGAFAQADSFQLFSMGPDARPNTDDDVKGWDER